MMPAKLIKDLEKKGFELDFPSYESNEGRIIEIIKSPNRRLRLAIPLLLQESFDYDKIARNLLRGNLAELEWIILITDKIFREEKIDNSYLRKIIREHKIKGKISKQDYEYYLDAFRDATRRRAELEEKKLEKQTDIRMKLNIRKALSSIYSPGKIRIMDKIFQHEPLTNTELKYYYRSIRPLNKAILNDELRKYLQLIESSKKMKNF